MRTPLPPPPPTVATAALNNNENNNSKNIKTKDFFKKCFVRRK
jgi:hypothetical protein